MKHLALLTFILFSCASTKNSTQECYTKQKDPMLIHFESLKHELAHALTRRFMSECCPSEDFETFNLPSQSLCSEDAKLIIRSMSLDMGADAYKLTPEEICILWE